MLNISDIFLNHYKKTMALLNNANLSNANLQRVDLSGADLSGANLSGANLSDVIYDQNTILKCVNHDICI